MIVDVLTPARGFLTVTVVCDGILPIDLELAIAGRIIKKATVPGRKTGYNA